ncbi:P-loop containing nucleoside triphosphate hydrolase protein [Paraphysoderma sedebokerense]|nr:P-loop containing nucleoside triphosphate hydrolase protein [Paraphysoderma sedebokerense]
MVKEKSKKSKDKKSKSSKSDKSEKKSKKSQKEKVQTSNEENGIISDSITSKKRKVESHNQVDESKSKPKKQKTDLNSAVDEAITDCPIDSDIPKHLRLSSYRISSETVALLASRNINSLFPIQAETFDYIYEGKDILGRARTGTGKTLAFALPIIEKLKADGMASNKARGRPPKVLVLAPTRELAKQVSAEFEATGGQLSVICIYGGVAYDGQIDAFRNGVDVVVGTPGRIIDHIESGRLKLQDIRYLVLDEADQMLDMGFAESMEQILSHVQNHKKSSNSATSSHQTLLFSATFPSWINDVVSKFMKDERVTVDLVGDQKLKTSEKVRHLCINAHWSHRKEVIGDVVQVYAGKVGKTIIFTNSKAEANDLALNDKLKSDAQVIHGDIAQNQREVTLKGFREGKFRTLVATDVAARGLDIPEVDLIVNMEPPKDIDTYVHRSGRTGRGATTKLGTCVTFYKPADEYLLNIISKRTGTNFSKVSVPQPSDIIKASAEESKHYLETVSSDVLDLFEDTAKEVIEQFGGGVPALTRALAWISGYTEKKQITNRSLFSGAPTHTTLMFRLPTAIRHVSYVRTILTRTFPTLDPFTDLRTLKIAKDKMSVVFDIVNEKVELKKADAEDDSSEEIWITGIKWENERGVNLEVCNELPELVDSANGNGYGNNNFTRDQRGGGNYQDRNSGGRSFGNYGRGGRRSDGGYNNSRYGNDRGNGRGRGRGSFGRRH